MRPYKVLLFIACVMACLAALCSVLPHRIALGEKEVRWPTLAEVMGSEPVLFDTLELVDTLALAEVLLCRIPLFRKSRQSNSNPLCQKWQ